MEYKIDYEKLTEALSNQLKINSEQGAPVTEDGVTYPFGNGPRFAMENMFKLAEEMGFPYKNVDNFGGHIDFPGESGVMGILGHLDVVPAGTGWDVEPYSGTVKDGVIYGRGATDDKGPVMACLFAMKALKDAGFKPKHTIRLILGLDEETGWIGMTEYLKREGKPDFGFTPDADFPLVYGEKGIAHFQLVQKFSGNDNLKASGKDSKKGMTLRSITGGTAPNAVPETARAVILNDGENPYDMVKALIENYRESTGRKVNYKVIGKSFEILTFGKAAHGATPEVGVNAISILMDILGKINFASEETNDIIAFYNRYIGLGVNGEKMDLDLSDKESGRLTFNVGMIDLTLKAVKITVDIRYPVTFSEEQIYEKVTEAVSRYDMGIVKLKSQHSIYKSLDDPMVKALMDAYQEETGDYETKPMVIGGGTYARATENVIAFGALLPGREELAHQANERIAISDLNKMADIYARAIYKLNV